MSVFTAPTPTCRSFATCSYERETLLLIGSMKALSASNIVVFPWAAYSALEPDHRFIEQS